LSYAPTVGIELEGQTEIIASACLSQEARNASGGALRACGERNTRKDTEDARFHRGAIAHFSLAPFAPLRGCLRSRQRVAPLGSGCSLSFSDDLFCALCESSAYSAV